MENPGNGNQLGVNTFAWTTWQVGEAATKRCPGRLTSLFSFTSCSHMEQYLFHLA